jgi:hypothetical protein
MSWAEVTPILITSLGLMIAGFRISNLALEEKVKR